MELSYLIIEVLKRHSSEKAQGDTHPLNRTEILGFLQKDYGHLSEEITAKKVRRAVEEMAAQEAVLPEQCRMLRFHRKNGRITGYWTANDISDPELKYLIDCVVYGNIINTQNAQSLAKRLQGLSGKNLYNLTPYASGAFGSQKYLPDIDVLENVNVIMRAQMKQVKIKFRLNVFDAKDGRIVLSPVKEHIVSPIEIVLHSGRYYLVAAYNDGDKLYFFRVDLMDRIRLLKGKKAKKMDDFAQLKDFQRSSFMLRHPVMYGGREKWFKLRVERAHFTQVVDTFSSALKILPGSDTGDTIDVEVYASEEAMRLWLLQYGDIVEALDIDSELAAKLQRSIEILQKKYGGISRSAL